MKHNSISVSIAFRGNNNANSLVKCVRSFYNQRCLPREIIIIGSKEDLTYVERRLNYKKKCELKFIYTTIDKNCARNIGIKESEGNWVLYIDHDMVAGRNLLRQCLRYCNDYDVLIIPEARSKGNFWENCRRLEKELIKNDLDTVTPRFFRKSIFRDGEKPFDQKFGQLDEWGFNINIKKKHLRVKILPHFLITVHKKQVYLLQEMKRKFVRGLWLKNMIAIDGQESWRRINPIKRGIIFYFRRINYLFLDPMHFLGLIILKTLDFISFVLGVLSGYIVNVGFQKHDSDVTALYDHLSGDYLTSMYTLNSWSRYIDRKERIIVHGMFELDKKEIIKSEKILDLGMGPGRWSKYFIEIGFHEVSGLDISEKMILFAKKYVNSPKFKAIKSSMEAPIFKGNQFDKVFCFRAFKYSSNPERVLKETYRVLKNKGSFLLEFSNKSLINLIFKNLSKLVTRINSNQALESRWKYYLRANFYHVEEVVKMARRVGLKVIEAKPVFVLPSVPLPCNDKTVIFWEYLDKILFILLPKIWFARSWILLLKKNNIPKII